MKQLMIVDDLKQIHELRQTMSLPNNNIYRTHGNVLMPITQHTIIRLFDPSTIDHSPIYLFTVICSVNTVQLCVVCLKSNHFLLLNVYLILDTPPPPLAKYRVQRVKFGKK